MVMSVQSPENMTKVMARAKRADGMNLTIIRQICAAMTMMPK
jgi:hypothetical protein